MRIMRTDANDANHAIYAIYADTIRYVTMRYGYYEEIREARADFFLRCFEL